MRRSSSVATAASSAARTRCSRPAERSVMASSKPSRRTGWRPRASFAPARRAEEKISPSSLLLATQAGTARAAAGGAAAAAVCATDDVGARASVPVSASARGRRGRLCRVMPTTSPRAAGSASPEGDRVEHALLHFVRLLLVQGGLLEEVVAASDAEAGPFYRRDRPRSPRSPPGMISLKTASSGSKNSRMRKSTADRCDG